MQILKGLDTPLLKNARADLYLGPPRLKARGLPAILIGGGAAVGLILWFADAAKRTRYLPDPRCLPAPRSNPRGTYGRRTLSRPPRC